MKQLILAALAGLLPLFAVSAQVPAARAAVDFTNAAATPGVWSYGAFAGGSEAAFRDTSGTMRLAVRCVRTTRQVTISTNAAAPASSLSVWTSSAQRMLAARFDPAALRVSAQLHAHDRLLDAIAFSRGRIAISTPGALPLILQPAPEAARVFEDCRK